jgi:hypothetical protein
MIATNTILLKTARNDLGGEKEIKREPNPNVKLDDKMVQDIEKSEINVNQFILMEEFATYLPRGKRKLKLNMPELRDHLLSSDKLNPLTNTDGLRSGGTASMVSGDKAKPLPATKEIKEMSQKSYLFTIKNKNRVRSDANLNNGFNPNYSSFKNKFKL